ncbi:MAG: LysR family transcriptional regulator [Lachnospiraceae bacterium]|jgi:DNA-binding transcriptional LysR family regulator
MTLQQLRYTLTIAQYGSFNEAAKALFVSQPNLSSSIRELEKELGITLFHRSNKGAALTADGQEFLGYTRQIMDRVTLLENRYDPLHQSVQTLSFSVSSQHYHFAYRAFTRLIRQLDSPYYNLALHESRTMDIAKDITNGKSELGFLYIYPYNKDLIFSLLDTRGLEFHPMVRTHPTVYFGENHPLASREVIEDDDLESYPRIIWEPGISSTLSFNEELILFNSPSCIIRVEDRDAMDSILRNTDSYNVGTVLVDYDNSDGLVFRRLAVNYSLIVGWVQRKEHGLTPIARQYLQFALEEAKQMGGMPLEELNFSPITYI